MATLRNKYHELGNWLNKLSMVTMDTADSLQNINLDKMSKEEVTVILTRVIKYMNQCGEFVEGADKATKETKTFVYAELGGESEILGPKDMWHCYLTRPFRFIVLILTWPFRQIRKCFIGTNTAKKE